VLVQFVHGTDVGIGFTCTCFHFYGKVVAEFYTFRAFYLLAFMEVKLFLYFLNILEYLRFRYLNGAVSIAYFFHHIRVKGNGLHSTGSSLFCLTDEFFAALQCEAICFEGLPRKTIHYRFYGLNLKVLFFEL